MSMTAGRQGATGNGRLLGARVLLAEDSWIIAEALKEVLQQQGAIVSGPAATLAEAQTLSKQGVVDAAVCDVNLRGQMATGFILELARSGIAVVVLSGYAVDPQLRAEVAACLEKPVSEDKLVATVASILKR